MGVAFILVIIPLLLFVVIMLISLWSNWSWGVAAGVIVALAMATIAIGTILKVEKKEEEDIEKEWEGKE